ncbi:MAG: succinic semialdehyde dehydrogenase [Acidimicrobiia bacterium]
MLADETQLAPRVTPGLLRSLEARIDVPPDREQIPVVAPFTLQQIGSVPQALSGDVTNAVAVSRQAQKRWEQLTPTTRGRIFTRFHDLLIDRADEAMDLVQLEAGKARVPAFEEVFDTVGTTRYYANTAPGLLRRRRRRVSFPLLTKAYEYKHPHGVVGFITPWNFPFTLGISDAVPALLAGNGAVIKPDEKTPYSTLYAVRLLEEAGLPEGLVQVVTGRGDLIGRSIVDSVDFIMFTGSTDVGRLVAEQAGRRVIGMAMELGGKNAAIVLADADLDKAVPGIIRAVYANGGQLCIAAERIYVEEPVLAEFTERFVRAADELDLSLGYEFPGMIGSMITQAHLDDVHHHVEDAVARGAKLLAGGKPRPDVGPLVYAPTVLTDVDESMEVCRTETFGPVVSIYGVPDAETAIQRANDSHLGLNLSVWTRNTRAGVELAARLEAGTVGVNDGYAATWSSYDAPMGGMKASGLSRRHGSEGILKYTDPQTVAVQHLIPAFAPPCGMSYDRYSVLLGKALKLLRRMPFYK